MRKRIAERMTEARATIAQGSCARLVDVSGIERRGASWTAYFVKAFAQALEADRIGVAVEVPGGLVVPVVPDARDASLHDISVRIADLAERARTNALTANEVGGAAATVTNVGVTGTLLGVSADRAGRAGHPRAGRHRGRPLLAGAVLRPCAL